MSDETAGRVNHPDGGAAGGYNLITGQAERPRPPSPRKPQRPTHEAQGAPTRGGKLDARKESTEYDLVTGAKKGPRKAAKPAAAKPAASAADPRASRRRQDAPKEEVDVLNRPRPPSPRKRTTGKTTVTFMDKAGGGLNPLTGEVNKPDADPRKSSKAKRELQRKLSDSSADPVTHKPRAQAPYGTDSKNEPGPQKPSSVNRMEREIRELHKNVDPLTGKKRDAPKVRRSTSGQYKRETAVTDPVNPVTGKAAPQSPRKKGATTGAYTREMQETGRDVDPITGKKKGASHARRSSSGYINRQVAEHQETNPITGATQKKSVVKGTKGQLTREMQDRPVNPVTGQ